MNGWVIVSWARSGVVIAGSVRNFLMALNR